MVIVDVHLIWPRWCFQHYISIVYQEFSTSRCVLASSSTLNHRSYKHRPRRTPEDIYKPVLSQRGRLGIRLDLHLYNYTHNSIYSSCRAVVGSAPRSGWFGYMYGQLGSAVLCSYDLLLHMPSSYLELYSKI